MDTNKPQVPGYYWAKMTSVSNEPEGEDWLSGKWEIVEVNDNNGEGDEALSVQVFGIPVTQWLHNFEWGEPLHRQRAEAKAAPEPALGVVEAMAKAVAERGWDGSPGYRWTNISKAEREEYRLDVLAALSAAPSRDDVLEEALDCQPSTAENPNEDAYQRGRFDGIMEFAAAIRNLKDASHDRIDVALKDTDHVLPL